MFTMLLLKLGGALCSIFATASVADWIFSGSAWAHKYYGAHPEIWRGADASSEHAKRDERRLIRSAMLVTVGYSIAYILAYVMLSPGLLFGSWFTRSLAITFGFWLVVAVPLALTQHLFIKFHRMSTILLLVAWFVKLLLASIIMSALF